MKSVNLIPAPRLVAKQRRAHVRRCAAGCAAWAVLSLLTAGAYRATSHPAADTQPEERLASAAEEVERTERAIAGVKVQLAAAQSTLRANQAIANQPDWSVLLALLAANTKQDVVLKNCHVHPAVPGAGRRGEAVRTAAPSSPAATAAGTGATPGAAAGEVVPFVLEAEGWARTQAAAHRFVRDLEAVDFFGRVTLLRTSTDPYLNEAATAFKLECSLDAPPDAPGNAGVATTGGEQAAVDKR